MSYEIPGKSITLQASVDLSSSQYTFVDVNGSGQAAVPALGANAVGVVVNKPTAGQDATVVTEGVIRVVASAAIAQGASVTSDAAGKAITAVAGNYQLGRALTAAGGAGEYVSVLLIRGGKA